MERGCRPTSPIATLCSLGCSSSRSVRGASCLSLVHTCTHAHMHPPTQNIHTRTHTHSRAHIYAHARAHTPFRSSTLAHCDTVPLRPTGGNSKLVFLGLISPYHRHDDDTVHTLKVAEQFKHVYNTVRTKKRRSKVKIAADIAAVALKAQQHAALELEAEALRKQMRAAAAEAKAAAKAGAKEEKDKKAETDKVGSEGASRSSSSDGGQSQPLSPSLSASATESDLELEPEAEAPGPRSGGTRRGAGVQREVQPFPESDRVGSLSLEPGQGGVTDGSDAAFDAAVGGALGKTKHGLTGSELTKLLNNLKPDSNGEVGALCLLHSFV